MENAPPRGKPWFCVQVFGLAVQILGCLIQAVAVSSLVKEKLAAPYKVVSLLRNVGWLLSLNKENTCED